MQELIEKLSDLEHRQWRSWTEHLIENEDIPEELEEKWKKNHVPYEELSEEEKEKDRKWARKVMKELPVYKVETDTGNTLYSSNIDDLPLHKDFVKLETLKTNI